MKKIHMIAALLAMLLPITQVWGNSSNYYAYTKVVRGTGCGKVYVNNASETANPDYQTSDYTSDSQGGDGKSNTGYKFYVYAQNKHGYKFKTWSVTYTDDQSSGKGSATITSGATSENGCCVTVTTGTKDFGNNGGNQKTTATATATYEQCTNSDPHYTLTMGNEAGTGSYTITGPVDFPTISPGGSTTVWFNDVVSFAVTPAAGYDFVRWRRVDASGTSYSTDEVLSTQSFTSDTTIAAEFKKQVTIDALCQGSVGGTYKANGTTISGSDQTLSNFGSITVSLSNPVANNGYAFYGWYIIHPNGVKEYLSYGSTASTGEKKENITVGADFVAIKNLSIALEASTEGSYTCKVGNSTPVTVNGEDTSVTGKGIITNTFNATPNSSSVLPKWYTRDEMGNKTYFAIGKTSTKIFADDATVGVDFIPANTNLMNAIAAAQVSGGMAALACDADIIDGTSVEIPSGVTIDLAGHTLYVDGTLTVNGAITGGTVSKCWKLFKQTGNDLEPRNPYKDENVDKKYWVTTPMTVNASVSSSVSGLKSHVSLMNGYGDIFHSVISNTSHSILICNINTSVAINHVTGLTSSTTNSMDVLYNISSTKMGLLLADYKYSSVSQATLVSDKKIKRPFGTLDCAGKTYELSMNTGGGYSQIVLNGGAKWTISKSSGGYYGKCECYNCQTIEVVNFVNRSDIYLNIYDCLPAKYITQMDDDTSTDGKVKYYSGGPYDPTTFTGVENCYEIYGGFYTTEPDKNRNKRSSTHKFYQHSDSYWYLEEKQGTNVAKVGDEEEATLTEAFEKAILKSRTDSGFAIITMLRNVEVTDLPTIPSDVCLKLNLAGCKITSTATDGVIVNNGVIEIYDDIGNLTSGIEAKNGFVIKNYGQMDITYGTYKGDIFLGGGKLITHYGVFDGSISVAEGVNDLDVTEIKGGRFTQSVNRFLRSGYKTFNSQSHYWVSQSPIASVSGAYNSAGQVWTLEFLSSAVPSGRSKSDKTLYAITSDSLSACNNNFVDWRRRAELKSALLPLAKSYLDCAIGFDRGVAAGTVTISAPQAENQTLPRTLTANELEYLVVPSFYSRYAPWQYVKYLLLDANSAGIVSYSNNKDKGTVFVVKLGLYDSVQKNSSDEWYSVVDSWRADVAVCHCVIGAQENDVAMIRPATGAATFYSTLSAAMGTVANGGTVMLANDCTEKPHFATAGTYIVDSMGFEHGFSGAEGGYTVAEGLSVTAEIVDSSVKALIPSATAIKYVVSKAAMHPADYVVIPSEHLTEWGSDNGITGSTETEIREALKQEDENGIAKWENVVMGQNGTTPAAIVTSTNGTETTANMEVSFKPPSNIGYTVKYAFDEVAIVGAVTNVVNVGSVTNTPTLDLSGVTTNSPSYFKMRAVLESTDDKHTITTNVPVDKVIGVMKVDSDATFTILAVPWKAFDGGNVKVSELVHAASLSTDDMLYAYDGKDNLKSWCVKDGVWVSMTESEGGQQSVTPDPAGFGLVRGKGVWLKRENVKSPIYLMGQPTTETATTTLTAAPDENTPSWNLVASPRLATDFSKFNTGDEIIVPTAGTPKHYTYKNNAWGYPGATVTETKTLPNGQTIKVIKTEHKTNDTTVAPGTGFWYLNKGDEKTITW